MGKPSWVVQESDDQLSDDEQYDKHKILSQKEKKAHWKEFTRVEKCDHFYTMKDQNNSMGDVKSHEFITKLRGAIEVKDKVRLVYAVVGVKNQEDHRTIEVAFKLETKRAVSVGAIMKKVYKMFPLFHGKIEADKAGKEVYLNKARRIVAPLEAVDIDADPLVYNETLYNLLRRIQNGERGQEGPRDVWATRTKEMEEAVVRAAGSWKKLAQDDLYKKSGKKDPLSYRVCFDQFSPHGEDKGSGETGLTEDEVKKKTWIIADKIWRTTRNREIEEDRRAVLSGNTPKKRRSRGPPVGSAAPAVPERRSAWQGRALP